MPPICHGSWRLGRLTILMFRCCFVGVRQEAGHRTGEFLKITARAWVGEIDDGTAISAVNRAMRLQNGDACDSLFAALSARDGRVEPIDFIEMQVQFHCVRH